MAFTELLKTVPFTNQFCEVAPTDVLVKFIVPFKQMAVEEAVKFELTVHPTFEEHNTFLAEFVFRTAVDGEINVPPVEDVPTVEVSDVTEVVMNPVAVISLQPDVPLASVLTKRASFIPAPKLTV